MVGQSYGTYLGETLAAMFPDRIERMVLDAVLNPHEYRDGWYGAVNSLMQHELIVTHREPEALSRIGGAFDKWVQSCVEAGPEACALASGNTTADSLKTQLLNLLDSVKQEPIIMGTSATTDVVSVRQIIGAIDSTLRLTVDVSIPLAVYLQAIIDRNTTAYRRFEPVFNTIVDVSSTYGIRCSDATFRTENFTEIQQRAEQMTQKSPTWAQLYISSYAACSAWKSKARGSYEGNFQASTRHPILFIGSPFDGRTPIEGAYNASAGFDGSIVLQHNGLGVRQNIQKAFAYK